MFAKTLVIFSVLALAAPSLAADPTARTSSTLPAPPGQDPAGARKEHAHRRRLIAAQKKLVSDLSGENKQALEDGSIPAIERIDAAVTKAKADLKELILQDKQIETADAARAGATTNPMQSEPETVVFVCDATGSMINKMVRRGRQA